MQLFTLYVDIEEQGVSITSVTTVGDLLNVLESLVDEELTGHDGKTIDVTISSSQITDDEFLKLRE